ncbi:CBO0543 family protein [Halalkalibacter alkalisediminis]|uniref:CBO0543 family protein n=1 Tax=Halalkalibacter alkalisediminis TaxID=935616 RepID=A0ABV6NED3_9BACI|nr:CBO0543 family protein [Halalkalibacter alkalisediminis]
MVKTQIFDEYSYKEAQLMNEKFQIWLEHSLFTWQWWFGVIVLLLAIIFWLKFRDRNSTDRLLYSGLFVAITASFLDTIGHSIGLFHYHYEVFPFTPTYLPWSIAIIPIIVMFFLQYKPNVNPLLKSVIFSTFASFIALPLLSFIRIFHPVKWNYFYSFLILIVIYLMAHFFVQRNNFEKIT